MDFNQNLSRDKDLQVLFVVGPKIAPQIQDGRHLNKLKNHHNSCISLNHLTDLMKLGMVMRLFPSLHTRLGDKNYQF